MSAAGTGTAAGCPARVGPSGALMVCGTSSDAGKSQMVAGICRVLARRGVRVAPFKGQNMSLNSVVTPDGAEIGRAQWVQALAAGAPPEAAMNPVLLKPTGERESQVVVLGRPWRTLDAVGFHRAKAELVDVVDSALADLRRRYDLVVLEGAGSAAEINLLDHDLVNLGLAARSGIPALVVGDIDRGGVFAHLFGTVALLPDGLSGCIRGFVINKFRGDPALLGDATSQLEARCGVPTLGVMPFLSGTALDAEDSLALSGAVSGTLPGAPAAPPEGSDVLDVAVVRFPRISNFTDLDPLVLEPGVAVRFVDHPAWLGEPDLVVLPGTKATMADRRWLRRSGLEAALGRLRTGGAPPVVLGICGGYQMLGRRVEDPDGVEDGEPAIDGLGWLDVVTRFERSKWTAWRRGVLAGGDVPVSGYEIRHGRPDPGPRAVPWFRLEAGGRGDGGTGAGGAGGRGVADPVAGRGSGSPDQEEGVRDESAGVLGTSLHGVLESDAFRGDLLAWVAGRRGKFRAPSAVCFARARQDRIDRVADACEAHLDLDAVWAIAEGAAGREGSR